MRSLSAFCRKKTVMACISQVRYVILVSSMKKGKPMSQKLFMLDDAIKIIEKGLACF
ncbi:hypothetical protein CR513_53936, partial [Mucuna pruriens]